MAGSDELPTMKNLDDDDALPAPLPNMFGNDDDALPAPLPNMFGNDDDALPAPLPNMFGNEDEDALPEPLPNMFGTGAEDDLPMPLPNMFGGNDGDDLPLPLPNMFGENEGDDLPMFALGDDSDDSDEEIDGCQPLPAPAAPQAEFIQEHRPRPDMTGLEEITVTFRPQEKLFIKCFDWDLQGIVTGVDDGQAKEQGVEAGWCFKFIDGKDYDINLLDEKIDGTVSYNVTFAKREYLEEEHLSTFYGFAGRLENPTNIEICTKIPEEIPEEGYEFGYGKHVLNGWTVGNVLGDGAYAQVCIANKEGKVSAAKITNVPALTKKTHMTTRTQYKGGKEYSIPWRASDMIKSELKVLMECIESEYVVDILGTVEDRNIGELLIFLEFAPHGDIMDWSAKKKKFVVSKNHFSEEIKDEHFTEDASRNYFRCLIMGLKDLHDKQICHFDIKPQNLLVFGQGKAKLTDFGTCIFYRDEDATVRGANCGTLHFYSPGSADNRIRSPYGDDIWAAGCTLYAFLTGHVPFFAETGGDYQLFELIKSCDVSFIETMDVSENCKDLLRGILRPYEDERLTIEQILAHPWMQEATN